MSVTDPIADMLTMIRNAVRVKKRWVVVPTSNMRRSIVDLLERESFIRGYKTFEGEKHGQLRVYLKYDRDNNSVITDLQRVSTPGRRVYVKSDKVPRVLNGLGTAVISTSSGIVTDKEARKRGVGGEWVCNVW